MRPDSSRRATLHRPVKAYHCWVKYLERLGPRSLLLDAALALTIFVGGMVGRFELSDVGFPFSRQPDALNAVFIAMMSLPLVLRRVFPVTVFVLVVFAWGIDRVFDYPSNLAAAGVVVAFHTIGTELPRRRSLLIGGTAVLAVTGWTALGAIALRTSMRAALRAGPIEATTPARLPDRSMRPGCLPSSTRDHPLFDLAGFR